MILHQAQSRIARDTHRFRVLNCGRRFGKSTLAAEEIKGIALYKEAKIAYISPTFQSSRDIMWEMLKKELRPIIKKTNESRLELEVMNKDGKSSMIYLRGWEAVETMRGQAFDLIVLDEVAQFRNFWVGWNEVLSPTLIDRKGQAMFISTPRGFNHFYDLYGMQDKDKDYKSFHFTSYDNPNIPKEELDREKLSKPEDAFAQEYLADFRKQEGLVFKEFRRDYHVHDGTPKQVIKTIAGIDFGYTNPAAVLTVQKDYDNSYWIRSEWYKTQKTDEQIAEYVANCKFNEVYPDPESPSAIAELEKRNVFVKEVVKNKDSIKNGISKMRALFLGNKLHIHPSCVNLISELETYRYPEKRVDSDEYENPIHENCHAIDACRYIIMADEPEDFALSFRMKDTVYRSRESKKSGYE